MLKNLKKVKWYQWLILGIYTGTYIFISCLIDIPVVQDLWKSMPLEYVGDQLPYLKNCYEFMCLIQFCWTINLLFAVVMTLWLVILRWIKKNVEKKD